MGSPIGSCGGSSNKIDRWRKSLSGRADLAYQLTDRVTELTTSHAGQVYLSPQSGIFYMGLNRQTPPFDDVRVRRALNFAVDRGTIAALFEGRGFQRARSSRRASLGMSRLPLHP